jgi:hypothetical protein
MGVRLKGMDEQATVPTLQAAELIGVDVLDVYRMIDEGRLTPSWDGKRLVVPVAEVESLVRSSP